MFFTMINMEVGKMSMVTIIIKMGLLVKNLAIKVKIALVKAHGRTHLMMNIRGSLHLARKFNKYSRNSLSMSKLINKEFNQQ